MIAYVLSGPNAEYIVPLPDINEEKKAILETYTKEHSAEYQSQAFIDYYAEAIENIQELLLNLDR